MDQKTLELLGISKEDLQQRVVNQICESVMNSTGMDDEGGAHSYASKVANQLRVQAKKQIDDALNDFAAKFITPSITKYLETLALQPTSQYGESKGEPQTFLEYLTKRSEAWLSEEVNKDGKTRSEDSYSWSKYGTRAVYILDSKLQKNLTDMMTGQIAATHSQLGQIMEATVKDVFARTFSNLKVETATFVKPKA